MLRLLPLPCLLDSHMSVLFKRLHDQPNKDIFQIFSGITSGRVLDGELLYTEIQEVNSFAFAYRLFHEDLQGSTL